MWSDLERGKNSGSAPPLLGKPVMSPATGAKPAREALGFVHGSLGAAREVFASQAPLQLSFDLHLATRRGYAAAATQPRPVDHDPDAAELVRPGQPIHLVGTSTG